MTAVELRSIIARLGLSQCGLAKALGVSDRTVRYWLAGRPIPEAVALLLLFAVDDPEIKFAIRWNGSKD